MYPEDLADELADEDADEDSDADELLPAGLLYEGVDVFRPEAELPLPVRLPTLIPPLLVPVLGLDTAAGLLADECLPDSGPYDSVRARRP